MIALMMIVTGLTFLACFQYILGILTFQYPDINFLLHAQESIVAFATGSMVPLSLLPAGALKALRLLPFSHVIYTPSMLLIGQADRGEGLFGLIVLGVWATLTPLFANRLYHRLRMKYDGVGV
jgi:ABC-2 type transport system permease protein